MAEVLAVEAARAVGAAGAMQMPAAQAVPDPNAVQAFEEAMNAGGVAQVPFAAQISETWGTAQANYQGMLHRIRALTDMGKTHALSSVELSELQYEVANLSFQQEVVTNVSKKATDAISTLVKNG